MNERINPKYYIILMICVSIFPVRLSAQTAPPTIDPLEMQDPNETGVFPPRPTGIQSFTNLAFEEDPRILTEEETSEYQQLIKGDEDAKELLGDRFIFISAGREEVDKGITYAESPLVTVLTYYSYVNDVAIDFFIEGRAITNITKREKGYQPPTNPHELDRVRTLLTNHDLEQPIQNLKIRGIVTEGPSDSNRYIYLTFVNESGEKVMRTTFNISTEEFVNAEQD